mgnify:CR=1 FL=1
MKVFTSMKKWVATCIMLAASISMMAEEAKLSFADKAQRTVFDSSKQVWEQNGIVLTNNKGGSTNAVADYANPARFYKNSEIIVEYGSPIRKIIFDCNSSSYATALQSSITNGTVSANGNKITVTLSEPANSYTIAALSGGQVRMNGLTVYYGEESGDEGNEDEEGEELPEGTGEGTEANPYDAAKATKLAAALADGEKITGVYVKGIIKSIKEVSTQYGNATYYITDADNAANFYIYRGKYIGNTSFTSADQIKEGDIVVIYGDLMNYKGNSPQLGQSNYLVSINGGADSIEPIANENAAPVVYDLLGRRVDNPTSGIYIVNGKKVVIK